MNFIAASEKEHGVSLLAARTVDIIEDMVSSDFQTGNSRRTSLHYIWIAKFLLQRPKILKIEDIGKEKLEHGRLASPTSTMKLFSRPGQTKDCLWSAPQASGSEMR